MNQTVLKVIGAAAAAVLAFVVVLVLPKLIAGVVLAAVAGFLTWKYVAAKEVARIIAQGQAVAGKIGEKIDQAKK